MIRLGSECAYSVRSLHCHLKDNSWVFGLDWIVAMSSGLIIGLTLGFMIFIIISTVVHLKRRAKSKQNLGYTIHEGVGAGNWTDMLIC